MRCKMHRVFRSPGFRYAFAPAIGLAGAGTLAWNARDCAPSSRVPVARPSFLSSFSASMPWLAALPGIRPEFGLVSSRSDDSLARALEEALGQSGGASPQQPPPRSRFVRKRGPTSPSGRMVGATAGAAWCHFEHFGALSEGWLKPITAAARCPILDSLSPSVQLLCS